MLALERRDAVRIGLEVDHPIRDQREHQAIGVDPATAEHAAHLDGAEFGEKFVEIIRVHDGEPPGGVRRGSRPRRSPA
jgi:hypothetical protein